jgi:hypothetical protein
MTISHSFRECLLDRRLTKPMYFNAIAESPLSFSSAACYGVDHNVNITGSWMRILEGSSNPLGGVASGVGDGARARSVCPSVECEYPITRGLSLAAT